MVRLEDPVKAMKANYDLITSITNAEFGRSNEKRPNQDKDNPGYKAITL